MRKLGLIVSMAAMFLSASPSGADTGTGKKKEAGPAGDKTKKKLDYKNDVQPTTIPPLECPRTAPTAAFPEDWPLEELAGTLVDDHDFDNAAKQHAFATEAMTTWTIKPAVTEQACDQLPEFDWVSRGKVTPIRDQRPCGSCWDFAAIAAYETNYAIRNNELINASEQYSLDCATVPATDKIIGGKQAGTCKGVNKGPYHGGSHAVFNWMLTNGEDTEKQDPYQGKDLTCTPNPKAPYRAIAWDFVRPTPGIAAVGDIKKAICTHGGVVSSVLASNWGKYTCGVWKETGVSEINHSILIVGWNNAKKAWLVKNSWSPTYGQNGFIWLSWDSDNVGTAASWVEAAPVAGGPAYDAILALLKKHGLFAAVAHE